MIYATKKQLEVQQLNVLYLDVNVKHVLTYNLFLQVSDKNRQAVDKNNELTTFF